MLEIYVDNQKVDLTPDISIPFTIQNPFLSQDGIPVPHTFSFDLPATSRNSKILDNNNRIGSIIPGLGMYKVFSCRILFDAVTISSGFLEVTDFDKRFKVFFKAVEITDQMRESMFANEMQRFEFPTTNWANINFDTPGNFGYDYKTFAINASLGLNDKLVVAPVKIDNGENLTFTDGFFYIQMGDELIETPRAKNTASMMGIEYINYFNPQNGDFMTRWPSNPPPILDAAHASIFPFARLPYVLNKLLNDKLDNNFFDEDSELQNLVVPSFYFQNYYPQSSWLFISTTKGMMFENDFITTDPPYFKLNSFMPGIAAPEFIREVLSLFCSTLVPTGGRFVLKKNKDIIRDSSAENWDKKLIGTPVSSIQKGQVYRYGYGDRNNKSSEIPSTVGSIHEMISEDITMFSSGTQEKLFYISSTGQTIKKISERVPDPEDEESTILKDQYELINSGYGSSGEISGESYDATSNLKPLDVLPAQYWWTADNTATSHPETAWWAVPKFKGDRDLRPEDASLLFYRGYVNSLKTGHSYPLLTPYDVNPDGIVIGNYSLAWEGDNGLIEKFHKEFKAWIEKDRIKITSGVLFQAIDLHNLDITKKVYFSGRKFFIKEIRFTVKNNRIDPAVVDFIEA